jgi:exodeoxyribonuclease V beta subunit
MSVGSQAPFFADVPLHGLHLIEANAGTGKTWTIAALYLRLLCEARLPVEAILVVSFTEAATAELRGRIRERIAGARQALIDGKASDVVLQTILAQAGEAEATQRHLTRALYDFDRAAIYTIHGFCQRVLADSAFESGVAFEAEILPDVSDLLLAIVDDFWRTEVARSTRLWMQFLIQKKVGPQLLLDTVRPYLGKPYLEIRAPTGVADLAQRELAFARAYAEVRELWSSARSAVAQQFMDSPGLSRSSYSARAIPDWLLAMDEYLRPQMANLSVFDKFAKFTRACLVAGTKRGAQTPSHPFYDVCQKLQEVHTRLLDGFEQHLALLRRRLLEYCDHELAQRKRSRQVRSFDDLLLDLHAALTGPRGDKLANTLRMRYVAALIDEFQDTDLLQYGIFKAIYAGTESPVFLVGDPKQAIYSFRGADVYAYLKARREAQHKHILRQNWRSNAGLIAAVNALFKSAARPFMLAGIPFEQTVPAGIDPGGLITDEPNGAPLQMWFVDAATDGKPCSKAEATQRAANATAGEIARLLNQGVRGRAKIRLPDSAGERPLAGSDIAVLVRTHEQARAMGQSLQAFSVASVQHGVENVFATPEAEELQRILFAVTEPGRERLIRAALSTELLGFTARQLLALDVDVGEWEVVVERFRAAHRQWREHGFVSMMYPLLDAHGTFVRLLKRQDGERRATNLRHLLELLQRAAVSEGTPGLLKWLAAQRRACAANEEQLLRLESDENLVQIFTVHVSKGLEFPLVFCPFSWDGRLRSETDGSVMAHDPGAGDQPVLDFGSPRQAQLREQATREELAENLRLLYVALTRAKYRCWLVWGCIKDAETAALAWLLHRPQGTQLETVPALVDQLGKLDADGMRAQLRRLAARAEGSISVANLPGSAGARLSLPVQQGLPLSARRFRGIIGESSWITSFTGLTRNRPVEAPDYDAMEPAREDEAALRRRDIFGFPRGTTAGKCWHAIMERLDFTEPSRSIIDVLCGEQLLAHGFLPEWIPVVADMVERIVATTLNESGTLSLAGIASNERFNELEFHYPIARLSGAGLMRILNLHGIDSELPNRAEAQWMRGRDAARGFMKGYIDLVFEHQGRFYLVDYKSNWLGPALEHYQPVRIAEAMAREAYHLQYLLYCVALHRHLRARLAGYEWETHFGGVRYLFLRGMRPELGVHSGVFQDKPSATLIHELDAYLQTGHL